MPTGTGDQQSKAPRQEDKPRSLPPQTDSMWNTSTHGGGHWGNENRPTPQRTGKHESRWTAAATRSRWQTCANFCVRSGPESKSTPHPLARVPAACTLHHTGKRTALGLRLPLSSHVVLPGLRVTAYEQGGGCIPHGTLSGKGEQRARTPVPSAFCVCPTENPTGPQCGAAPANDSQELSTWCIS